MGGPNLEIFKFGLYIFMPVMTMFYFGTNLDRRFSVPDFWPKPEETHRIPFERDEIVAELERLKRRRLAGREQRLKVEGEGGGIGEVAPTPAQVAVSENGVQQGVAERKGERD